MIPSERPSPKWKLPLEIHSAASTTAAVLLKDRTLRTVAKVYATGTFTAQELAQFIVACVNGSQQENDRIELERIVSEHFNEGPQSLHGVGLLRSYDTLARKIEDACLNEKGLSEDSPKGRPIPDVGPDQSSLQSIADETVSLSGSVLHEQGEDKKQEEDTRGVDTQYAKPLATAASNEPPSSKRRED